MPETLILVDENDSPIGTQEKLEAHLLPQRHRAFSVFIFNDKGETLIQRRALGKYHSPGLWANSCCGHPRPGEDVEEAAKRRLSEEIGFCCPLTPLTKVCYTLKLEKSLWELEYTHVFKGKYEGKMDLNPEEVSEVRWISPEALRQDVLAHPQSYARWFRLYILKHFEAIFGSSPPSSFRDLGSPYKPEGRIEESLNTRNLEKISIPSSGFRISRKSNIRLFPHEDFLDSGMTNGKVPT